jgi:hypothetical protein
MIGSAAWLKGSRMDVLLRQRLKTQEGLIGFD